MENYKSIKNEIKSNLTRKCASRKDEIIVMKAMLNDPDFKVTMYGKDDGEYSPFEDSRSMMAHVISETTKIGIDEARELANNYEINKNDAESFIRISKEFVHEYLDTGRKLPIGSFDNMNPSLSVRHVESKDKINSKGETVKYPAYDAIKVSNPAPKYMI